MKSGIQTHRSKGNSLWYTDIKKVACLAANHED